MTDAPWSAPLRFAEVFGLRQRERLERRLTPDAEARGRIARFLDLRTLDALDADITVAAWFDGLQIDARWRANIEQTCSITLEPLPSRLEGRFTVRVVPESSTLASHPAGHEIVVDPDADDPPDVAESDTVDLAAYVIEHLALEIDPFPRKPGVEFEPPAGPAERSPFDVLRRLKDETGDL